VGVLSSSPSSASRAAAINAMSDMFMYTGWGTTISGWLQLKVGRLFGAAGRWLCVSFALRAAAVFMGTRGLSYEFCRWGTGGLMLVSSNPQLDPGLSSSSCILSGGLNV